MCLEGHYTQNTISHCIISNETQITFHFFQGRISAMPLIRADLFLAISKTGMCLLTLSVFLNQGLKKVNFITFFKLVKILYDSELTSYQNTFFYNFILNNHVSTVYFRKK